MASIAIYGKRIPDEARPFIERILGTLQEEGCQVTMYRGFQKRLNESWDLGLTLPEYTSAETLQALNPDFLMVIGGDGTILDACSQVGRSGIPLIGINTGRLGFLANITRDEAPASLKRILQGAYRIEERYTLQASAEGPELLDPDFALNEIAVSRKGTTSMISIHVHLNGQFLNTYWADGLIISTPTGSTGYNLSCGGPILMPLSPNFILTPIAPHNLTVRPLVIPNNGILELRIEAREDSYLCSMDSRVFSLDVGTTLKIQQADFKFRLVQTEEHNFPTTLRNKLLWGLDRRN
ncbi:MAG: NAD kinase [Schleiferiaceae bacterium]|jgi:NAD+ kinase|nr:NAD kinase [Schleiferiaceae bacterium]MDP4628655.1 NAD kinase [Schleiferiaceae bacterium]MDP4773372.1 NAD kinase [Schleiferiaceae bacterium]MDP4931892.1 NAD kinase [Schleiferiaceae bacterium]